MSCRFCHDAPLKPGEARRAPLVKYGVRHYAHADCGLKAKGIAFLESLTDWQCTVFPEMAAMAAGPAIYAELKRRCELYYAERPEHRVSA